MIYGEWKCTKDGVSARNGDCLARVGWTWGRSWWSWFYYYNTTCTKYRQELITENHDRNHFTFALPSGWWVNFDLHHQALLLAANLARGTIGDAFTSFVVMFFADSSIN